MLKNTGYLALLIAVAYTLAHTLHDILFVYYYYYIKYMYVYLQYVHSLSSYTVLIHLIFEVVAKPHSRMTHW